MSTLYIYTGATDRRAAVATSLTDTTAPATCPNWVLGDSQPLTLIFTTGTAAETWDGSAAYACTIGLGMADDDGDALVTTILTPSGTAGSGWTGRIPLTTQALIDRINYLHGMGRAKRFARLQLQAQVTDPSNNPVSYALVDIELNTRVLPAAATPTPASASYYTTAQLLTLFVQNRGDITALTGGGALALDGIPTAGEAQPTGAVVQLSINDVDQKWKLKVGTTAEDGLTVVRPDDYDPTTNARYWALL